MADEPNFTEKLKTQLDELAAELDDLAAKADRAQTEARFKMHDAIKDLRTKQKEAKAKLEKLIDASDDALDDLKTGAEIAWSDLKMTFESVRDRFK